MTRASTCRTTQAYVHGTRQRWTRTATDRRDSGRDSGRDGGAARALRTDSGGSAHARDDRDGGREARGGGGRGVNDRVGEREKKGRR